jgi:co-chaperonin GroES (HSP10)
MKVRPLPGNIFAILEQGERTTKGGIVLRDDNGKLEGVRPRWGKVWQVAEDIKDVKPGDWILCEHGRWTMSIEIKQEDGEKFKFQKIDPNGILMIADEKPNDVMFGESFDTSPNSAHRAEDFGAR